jgi:hypothetical protein
MWREREAVIKQSREDVFIIISRPLNAFQTAGSGIKLFFIYYKAGGEK